ncbi:MAG: 5-(carboxyamino)imidazole ribonucleotide synthase [Phototrophicales bacterium]|nr:MAG: 5-(carboxyamino)imidazole ribonucleotide synthase [Phototrophicales bacterium]RMG75514.1 MAG: 5-(carboxyamino)imidazole ribonucleotide synthase [Chloroflexota bacterium]
MRRLGILGGGQLAQMTIQAAISLGVETAIFERFADSPASRLTHHTIVGDWQDRHALEQFAKLCDVITLENEFVDASVLQKLVELGVPVYPTAETLAQVQDKLIQKTTMQQAGIPVPRFCGVETPDDVVTAAAEIGYPLLLKARRDGYDGYGNVTIHSPQDIPAAWEKLTAKGRKLLIEAFVPFVRELAVMVVRGRNGETQVYPLVETIQHNHVCHVVRAPAHVSSIVADKAADIALKAVEAIDGVGVFGVELFELENGDVVYNEIAPRPHNSGHYTIEACITSQFENHIRAVMGWHLGITDLVKPAAVMVNILGTKQGDVPADIVVPALEIPGAHVHLYGKKQVRPGRKMGHVTLIGNDIPNLEKLARQAVDVIGL